MNDTIVPVRKEISSREILPKRFYPEERRKEGVEEQVRRQDAPPEDGKGLYVDILV